MALRGNTSTRWNPPPPRTINGRLYFLVATLDTVAQTGHQNLTLCRLAHNNTLLHGYEGNRMVWGDIACFLVGGGDTQTLGWDQSSL